MAKLFTVVAITVALLACVGTTLAYPDPSTWDHNDPSYTYQIWNFATSANPAISDYYTNPYGQPNISITGGIWQAGDWAVSGSNVMNLTANIPGEEETLLHRLLFIEITYTALGTTWPGLASSSIVPSGIETQIECLNDDALIIFGITDNGYTPMYVVHRVLWEIWPQSSGETISVQWNPGNTTTKLHDFTAKTILVPEPYALLVLASGLGGILLRFRRR